jgi:hypothetical protein
VPVEWIGKKQLHNRWKAAVLNTCSRFDYRIPESEIDNGFEAMTRQNHVDFGLLNEAFQKKIISHLISEKKRMAVLKSLNPFLEHLGEADSRDLLIKNNKNVVLNHYNKVNYRKVLLSIYQKIVHHPIHQRIDKKALLSKFLDLEAFSLLKWEDIE